MSFDNKVDYIPNQPFMSAAVDGSDIEHKLFQKRKWQILIGVFLLVLVSANAVIWSQAPVYQSQSILHFSYKSKIDQGFTELAQQQITLHQQRLKSNRVLTSVSQDLELNHGLQVNVEALFQALSVEASLPGRIISLRANGSEPQILKPILDSLAKVYLQLIASETQVNNNEEFEVSAEQLALLELKISEQQQVLETFAIENNITSIERDENRVLSQTKNLGASLDETVAEQAQAQALLDSLNESIESGQMVIRPTDKGQIDATKSNLTELNSTLAALSEKYTQAYLERDPAIVAQQQKAKELEWQLAEQIKDSQREYLLEAQRNLSAANSKARQLNIQLVEQNKLAQSFSQKLEQYKRLDSELKALQSQAQTLLNQQVAQEVSKPFEAKITLLEPAFEPDFAIGPNYQFNTVISLAAATVAGVFSLLLYSFIFRQKVSSAAPNNIVVIPGQTENGHAFDQNSALGYAQQSKLSAPNTGLPADQQQLPPVTHSLRLLSAEECQKLFEVANNQGKVLIGLMLSGVTVDELSEAKKADFVKDYAQLQIAGQLPRQITLQQDLAKALRAISINLNDQQSIWSNIHSQEDFVQLLVNVGHDAQLAFPEQLSLDVLRHTYLTYLASQGARLNDIEQVAGYTSPSTLALYRNVNQQGKLIELEQIKTLYPFVEAG